MEKPFLFNIADLGGHGGGAGDRDNPPGAAGSGAEGTAGQQWL